MSLTRKMLSAMGIEADKIDQIIEAHAETVNGLKTEIETQKEKADKLPDIQKELDDLKKSYEGKDYDKLKKEYDDYKAEVQKRETQAAKEKAYREALKDANLTDKGIEKAIKYADWSGIELEDDGKLKDAKTHIKAVREEWAEYITRTEKRGADTSTPPSNTGGKLSREDIYKTDEKGRFVMDAGERQKALAQLMAEE